MRASLARRVAAAWARLCAAHPGTPPPVALDFETFYRSEKKARSTVLSPCSVDALGNWAYCRHAEWDAYLVAFYSPACPALRLPEISYCGAPEAAPWSALAGRTWLSHNRNFDRHACERLAEFGCIPARAADAPPWHDTADLAAYSHLPRALDRILLHHFALIFPKNVRAAMDGVRWRELDAPAQERVRRYALDDAAACWLVWAALADGWPEPERALSLHTGEIEFRGIPVDRARIARDLGVLATARWNAAQRISWLGQHDRDTGRPYTLRSRKALDLACEKAGVPPPASTAQKSPEFLEWLETHGARVPDIAELARYRRIDRALSIYHALRTRIRPDGRAALALKYFGAEKTGRWSGAGRFNLQNLLKTPLYFSADHAWLEPGPRGAPPAGAAHVVDVRSCFTASPGRRLVICDLSQIEPRVLNWLVGHAEFLRHLVPDAQGRALSPYEAHARASMGYAPPPGAPPMKQHAPGLYALAKARVLALGYGAGWRKFIDMARGYCADEAEFLSLFAAPPPAARVAEFEAELRRLAAGSAAGARTLDQWSRLDASTRAIWVNAWEQVRDFRRTNPGIADPVKGLWATLEGDFRGAGVHRPHEISLRSGRVLRYFRGRASTGESSTGWLAHAGQCLAPAARIYGGLLCENVVQATARDVFAHGLLNLEAAGFPVLFHVHDEAIVDAPAGADPAAIARLLTAPPAWCRDLPVAADCEVSDRYKK